MTPEDLPHPPLAAAEVAGWLAGVNDALESHLSLSGAYSDRESARRVASSNNLKQIALATVNVEERIFRGNAESSLEGRRTAAMAAIGQEIRTKRQELRNLATELGSVDAGEAGKARRSTVDSGTLQAEIKHLEAMQLALTTQGYDHAKERAYTVVKPAWAVRAAKPRTPSEFPDNCAASHIRTLRLGSSSRARRKDRYATMDVAKQGESEKRIEEALKSLTALDFKEQPLIDVIEYLKDRHNIQIQLDEEALRKTGITRDTPVTKSIKGVSLLGPPAVAARPGPDLRDQG